MRSAYLVLGVPGDANAEEIELAFHKAERLFTRERLAQEPGALDRLDELRSAYNVLRDPDSRAAHDRKLAGSIAPARPRVVTVQTVDEDSPVRKVTVAGVWIVGIVLALGIFASWRNAEARREMEAQEIASRKEAEIAAQRKREAQEQQAAERARVAAAAEAAERQLAREAQLSSLRASENIHRTEAAAAQSRQREVYEAQRAEANRRNEEMRSVQEARMRVEKEKAMVRQLCYEKYRRFDC